jgi:uncharacterized protein (DUF433 family)
MPPAAELKLRSTANRKARFQRVRQDMAKKKRRVLGRYIVADPEICHGKPTFMGSRVMVWQILRRVAKGQPWDEIVADWPKSVTKEAIAEAVELAQRAFKDHAPEFANIAIAGMNVLDDNVPTCEKSRT